MSESESNNDPSQGFYLASFLFAFGALMVTMFVFPVW